MVTAKDFLNEMDRIRAELDDAADREQAARKAAERAAEQHTREAMARQATEQKFRDARNGALVALLTPELVDVLAPKHERRNCHDGDQSNGGGRCARCTLLDARRNGFLDGTWAFTTAEAT
jgi:hypothetical protein